MPKDQPETVVTSAETPQTVSLIDEEQLVRENIGWMWFLPNTILGDRTNAEDAVQEAFISAFRGLPNFEGRSSLKTWMHRITVNAALMKLRQLKRLSEQSIDEHLPDFDQYDCRIEAPWPNLVRAEDVLESKQLRRLVSEKVAILPEAYRIVVYLRDIEGYDTNEVAEFLGISASNAKVRLHRARAVLKNLLEPILREEVS